MPLIMEDGINVDDLFGEPNSLELGLSAASPIKGLPQCLDEMRLLGCCQKIAWSRMGCIAAISSDGLRVMVRHLQCRPSDGKWMLEEESALTLTLETHSDNQLAHLSWNETGSELAVIDYSGRICLYSISIALNSISVLRHAEFDTSDDGSQVIGMMWLNSSQRHNVHIFHQAAKVNGRWAYSPFRRRPVGPFHPVNKGALICVTRAGQIKMLYQNPDSKWAEAATELKNTGYSDRLLTHASLTATQAGILLATYSACQKICLYKVHISWNPPQWEPTQGKMPGQFPVPTFHLVHCKVDMPSNMMDVNPGPDHPDQSLPFSNSIYSLTRLEIMPGQVDGPAGSGANPWILAVLSKPLHAIHDYPEQQGPSSIIVRWHLDSAQQTLHPKFDEVTSKKSNAQVKPKMELRRLEDIYCDKFIVSVDVVEHGAVLALTHDDSSITCYDTRTMSILPGVDDSSTVTSLAQVGFQYPPEPSGLHIAFSPNSCIAAVLDSDGQMQLRAMEHSFGSTEGLYDESNFSVAIAALTLAFSRGSGAESNTDDILMVALRLLTPEARITFISEVYRALPVNCNFTVEQDKLMSNPYIPRCLSLQSGLGFGGRFKPRSLSSAVPYAIIQLRHSSVLFAYFFQYNKGGQSDAHDPAVLRMVLGNTKWTLDFSHFLLNEIFDMADEFQGILNDPEAFAQKLKNTTSLPLLILLSSMSRAFLRFICRGLRGVHAGFATTNPASLLGDSRIYYTEICQALESSPVRIDVYEKFLAGVDSAVKHAYQGAGFGDAERPGPEKELLVNARIPSVLITAVATLFGQTVPALRSEINRMAIYLGDYSWLGFGNDRRTAMYRRQREVDIVKKCPLRPPLPLGNDGRVAPSKKRRCARCCEVSGDTSLPRSMLSFKMIAKLGLLRSCICGGMWVLETDTGELGTGSAGVGGNGPGHGIGINQA
ncbi:Mediator complex subunit Med16 [Penicillium bovifimosum]|uniref:Mediator of RNA polymerase II transcription subunit 16 n=1 Tax=Penicillium bovifimosum TaxID=126998 RepID=A0A9W9H2R9_9EURO|nr:Mediator complex subunit Med16 [Penicillium bovifimosum]KAJ5135801.1 Mediator complex subunit Med16 [Penicillium bovifimosum]